MTLDLVVPRLVFLICRLQTYAFPHADARHLLSQMSCTVQGKIASHKMTLSSGSGLPHAGCVGGCECARHRDNAEVVGGRSKCCQLVSPWYGMGE